MDMNKASAAFSALSLPTRIEVLRLLVNSGKTSRARIALTALALFTLESTSAVTLTARRPLLCLRSSKARA